MKIKKILIELTTAEKIYKKHGVYRKEIEDVVFEGRPLFFRAREQKYIAIALKERYVTIIFTYKRGVARIITAYPSSDWQIKLYKRRRLKK